MREKREYRGRGDRGEERGREKERSVEQDDSKGEVKNISDALIQIDLQNIAEWSLQDTEQYL